MTKNLKIKALKVRDCAQDHKSHQTSVKYFLKFHHELYEKQNLKVIVYRIMYL